MTARSLLRSMLQSEPSWPLGGELRIFLNTRAREIEMFSYPTELRIIPSPMASIWGTSSNISSYFFVLSSDFFILLHNSSEEWREGDPKI